MLRTPSRDSRFTDHEARVWAAEQARGSGHSPIAVLVVSPFKHDRAALRNILTPPDFHLYLAESAHEAEALLRRTRVPVVISDCRLKEGCWKDVCDAIRRLPRRPWPRLLVAATRAGDRLWAEIAGAARDVLAKPFARDDVIWAVTDAWMEWHREVELSAGTAPLVRHAGSA